MKVMHLLPALEQGGVERVVCDLNRLLVARGVDSVVVSRGGRLVETIEREGGRHVACELKSKNPLTYPIRAARLRKILVGERPDVVCVHSRVPAWLFVGANRRLHLPWITFAHGANSVSRYSEVMTRGDLTVTPSRFLKEYLTSNYPVDPDRIRIASPCVDDAKFDPAAVDAGRVAGFRKEWGVRDGEKVVMSVGRLTPLKGYDSLIRAFAEQKSVPVRLVIVGSADRDHRQYADSLKALASSLGVADRVVFAGQQSDVAACLAIADVVVSSNVTKPESFGLSIVEALAMGKPVIAKRFGGAAEIIEHGETGVLVERPEEFASAIGDVVSGRLRLADDLRERTLCRFAPKVYADAAMGAICGVLRNWKREDLTQSAQRRRGF